MTHPTRADEPDYEVTLTLRLTTRVSFARGAGLDDSTPILPSDAIDNAIGMILDETLEALADEFTIAYPIDGEATLLETA